DAAFGRLRGMFALAVWDESRRELILARDRFGIKPLYYYVGDGLLVFASELRALLASGLVPRRIDRTGLASFLANGSTAAPLTIVAGVRQLLPGQCLRASVNEGGRLDRVVSEFSSDSGVARPLTRTEAVAQLRAELEASVRAHLVSDVPLGVFLSGGMDSSALVALMSASGERPKTFSVVFNENEFDEARYSRGVAARFQTDHCEVRLGEDDLIGLLPQAIA